MGRKKPKNRKVAASAAARPTGGPATPPPPDVTIARDALLDLASNPPSISPTAPPDVKTAIETLFKLSGKASDQTANVFLPTNFAAPSGIFARRLQAEFLYSNAFLTGEWGLYPEIIRLCNEALDITDPVDPLEEPNMSDEKLRQLNMPETRIEHTLQCIRYLRENATNCAKNPVSMKSQQPPSSSTTATSPVKLQKKDILQKRKAIAQLKRQVQSYLESLSIADRKAMLSVKISDLREKLGELDPISSDALAIAERGHTQFTRWVCCYCDEKFSDRNAHKMHVVTTHVGDLLPKMKEILPKKPNKDWIERSCISGWSPLDDLLQQTSSSADTSVERAKILDRIHRVFDLLVDRGFLTASHVDKMVNLAITSILHDKPSAAIQLLTEGADTSNEFIRHSSATQLSKILQFLEHLAKSCEIDKDNDEYGTIDYAVQETHPACLTLDSNHELLLLNILNCGGSGSKKDHAIEDLESLVDWLYSYSSGEDHRLAWNRMLLECRNNLEKLQMEFSFFCQLGEEKRICSNAYDGLRKLGSRDLVKYLEELVIEGSNRVDLEALSGILKFADEANKSVTNWILEKMDQLNWQALELDGRIMRSWRNIQKMVEKIGPSSIYNYQIDLMQFVKSFLKTRLKDQMERDAREILEALQKEILGEEDKNGDQRKNNKGCDHPKQGKEKSKDKGKKKDSKKFNDEKDSGRKKKLLHEEITENSGTPVVLESSGLNTTCAESTSCDPLDESSLPSSTVENNFSKGCNDTSVVLQRSSLDRTCAETASWDPLDESIHTVNDNFSKSCNDTSMVLESSCLDRTLAEPSSCDPLDESIFPSGTVDDNFCKSCNGTFVVRESPCLDGTCAESTSSDPLDEIGLPLGVVDDKFSKSYNGASVVLESNDAEPVSCDPIDGNSLPYHILTGNISKSCNGISVLLESSDLDKTHGEPTSPDLLDETILPLGVMDDNFSKSCNGTSVVLESYGSDRTCAEPASCDSLDESSLLSGIVDGNFSKSCKGTSVVLESSGMVKTCGEHASRDPLDERCLPFGAVDNHFSKSSNGTTVIFENYGPDRTCAELATSVIFESYGPNRTCAEPASNDLPDENSLASGMVEGDFSRSCNGSSVVLESSGLDRTCAEPASCDPLDGSSFPTDIVEGNFSESCNDTSVVLESPAWDRMSLKPDFCNRPNERRFRSGLVDDNVSKRCKDDLVALNNDAEEYDGRNLPDESHLPSGVEDNNIYNSCMDLSMVLESVGQTEPVLSFRHHAQALLDKKWKEVIEGVYVEPTLSSEAEISDCLPDCECYRVKTQPESSDNGGQSSTGKQLDSIIRRTNSQGAILQNELGENKCLLNVIIQSLWHLRRFRMEFLECPKHQHILKETCFVCELHDIFAVMNKVSTNTHTKAADFALSWVALRKTDPNSSLFQLGQMNDAYKVLKAIFNRIHQSFASFGDCEAKVIDKNCIVLWDIGSHTCISHGLFGMSVYEKSVCECGNESQGSKYIQFFHRIDATLLRELKVTYATSSFDELLTKMKVALCACAYYGCNKLHHKIKFVSSPPHFYVIVLDWQSTSDTSNDILATLNAITQEIDLGVQYCGVYQGGKRILVSVISFDGQCYISCAYNSEQDKWVKYDGETVEDIGDWNEVCSLLGSLRSRPQVLLFEDPEL